LGVAIEGMADVNALSESIQGKKWIRRLRSDLEAVRAKYGQIRGADTDRLRELARLQGGEDILKSQLDLLQGGAAYEKSLIADLASLQVVLKALSQKTESR
jgi:hypothetical protein